MDEEGRLLRVPSARQPISRDISFVNRDTQTMQLPVHCPIHTMIELSHHMAQSAPTDTPNAPSGENRMNNTRNGEGERIHNRRDIPHIQQPSNTEGSQNRVVVPWGDTYYVFRNPTHNLRPQLPMPVRWESHIILDLDNTVVPMGVGIKSYGERVFIFTINVIFFRMNRVSFGNTNVPIPPGSRNCIIWIYKEAGLYRVTVEFLHDGKWISKEYLERGPGVNMFRQISLHIHDSVNSEPNNPFANETITPINLMLPTELDINDPNWIRGIPQGVFVVDMPGTLSFDVINFHFF